ncbi:Bud site selection protein, Revert to axial protein 1 [Dimargaris verticillata]|uniref:Bud site selection protein, Revert to axial protein 1 n=1 Tax=Dimargaris verticillata TaxID=2761393 RepID=A0A9W8B6J5_9FUNG|nr:Bud site selection protein, Revert to axial protein 1 [Dimargaris verticillata]
MAFSAPYVNHPDDRLSIMLDPDIEEKQQLQSNGYGMGSDASKRESRLGQTSLERKRQNRASVASYLHPHPDPLLRQHSSTLRNLPSLELVLSRKTCPPLCLYNYYVYMRDIEHAEENLDFWLDVVAHESLCKAYCQTLIKRKVASSPFSYLKRTNMKWTLKDVTQELRYSTYSNSITSESQHPAEKAEPLQPPTVEPADLQNLDLAEPSFGLENGQQAVCDHPYCLPQNDHTRYHHNPQSVNREDLKKSAERIYYRYIVAGTEHELNMPELMRLRICRMIEMEQRDDPDVFLEAKNYIFNMMAHDSFPRFLYARAYENMGYTQTMVRLVTGLVSLMIGFTVELCLIFLDRQPKGLRWFGLIPIWFGFLNLFVNQEKLCPLFTLLGISERGFCRFNRIRDSKVKGLHIMRAFKISSISLVIAVIVTLIFYVVPGHRL